MEKFKVDYYDILTTRIDIIGFDVNISIAFLISRLVFSIILCLFLLHIHLEGEY